MTPFDLDAIEARVLGSLSEKDLATPEYYPLSLNALVNACNQKSNRDPVTQYAEADVLAALSSLEQKGWIQEVLEPGGRVSKYRHRLVEKLELRRSEQAVLEPGGRVSKYRHRLVEKLELRRSEQALLTVLLLRGPQTAGELRTRTERLHEFADLDSVLNVLRRLAEREPEPLVRQLERMPGTKENRWAHLLCGEPEMPAATHAAPAAPGGRLDAIEEKLAALDARLQSQEERLARLEDLLRRFGTAG